MERINELNRYQKGLLILLAVMLVAFTVLYGIVSARVGYEYGGSILIPGEQNGSAVYTGTVRGKDAVITVAPDKTVTMHIGDRIYGPFTAKEDPTAVPAEYEFMTGAEIVNGGDVFFRGGVSRTGDGLLLIDEDGGINSIVITVYTSNGTELDMDGNPVDQMAPAPVQILELMDGPELTRKGEWMAWVMGVMVVVLTAVSILFADELFYIAMSFRVQNAEYAEPSDWEIAGRYIGWTGLTVMALVLFVIGLL